MLVFLVLARHGWCIGLITALRSRKTNRRSDGDGATMNELLQGTSHIFIKKKFGSSSMHEAWWLHLDGPGTFGLQVKPVVNLRISFLPWLHCSIWMVTAVCWQWQIINYCRSLWLWYMTASWSKLHNCVHPYYFASSFNSSTIIESRMNAWWKLLPTV